MSDNIFLDTNLWIYLFSKNPELKSARINELVSSQIQSIVISTQILGELHNVLLKKKFQTQPQAILTQLIAGFDILEIDAAKVLKAVEINARYGFSYWDSLVISTALLSECKILYSEDMQHGQTIETLKIINPFVS